MGMSMRSSQCLCGSCSELSWFSPSPLTLETKPLLKSHPKITLRQYKLHKHSKFSHEGVPGGFPDSLLLPPNFSGHVRFFLKVFPKFLAQQVHIPLLKAICHFAAAKPTNQKRGKNHHEGKNIYFLLIVLEKLYSQPKGGGALNWNRPALRLVCE